MNNTMYAAPVGAEALISNSTPSIVELTKESNNILDDAIYQLAAVIDAVQSGNCAPVIDKKSECLRDDMTALRDKAKIAHEMIMHIKLILFEGGGK